MARQIRKLSEAKQRQDQFAYHYARYHNAVKASKAAGYQTTVSTPLLNNN